MDAGRQQGTDAGNTGAVTPLLGVHNLAIPELAEEVGTRFVRMIALDRLLTCNLGPTPTVDQIRNSSAFRRVAQLHERGIGLVLSLRFPATPCDAITPESPDRIPTDTEREQALALQETVLRATAPMLVAYSLQNEVMNGPGRYEGADATPLIPGDPNSIPAVEWLGALAANARRVFDQLEGEHAFPAGRPLLISQAFVFNTALSGHDPETCDQLTTETVAHSFGFGADLETFHNGLIQVARNYTDAIDLHLHVDSVETAACTLRFMQTQVDLPIAVLEWSQAHANDPWLPQPVPEAITEMFVGTACEQAATARNRDLLECLETHPTDRERWTAFVGTTPAAVGASEYLWETWRLFRENRVPLVAYAGGLQYGSLIFDPTQLFANRTLADDDQRNEPFYSIYRELASGEQ